MLAQEIIARKRDAKALSARELNDFIAGVTDGSVSDAQVAAFAMAVLLNGMSVEERVALTTAMRDSGETLGWDLPGPVIDKHSTGGIGDNVSLVLAPALAACGAFVPMISGRGLGHTGGTLDKLEAIPGYRTGPDVRALKKVTAKVGCAIIGQTANIAPADKRIYAVRDVTATVESIDLICASILSKKLAAGLEALVLDVKVGSGAFMADLKPARALAEALCAVASGAGCKTTALITDMNEPLATSAGNALEVANAVKLLRGEEIDTRLWDVTVALGAEVLASSKLATGTTAQDMMRDALSSGAAAERFGQMVSALGGPADFVDRCDAYLDPAPVIREVLPAREGFVQAVDTKSLGYAVVELGGGRRVSTDTIDHAVGLDWVLGIGLSADKETPLCRIHARRPEDADRAEARLLEAFKIGPSLVATDTLIRERIS